MVKFKTKKTSFGLFLTVKDDKKILIILVFSPAIGPFGETWQVEYNPPNLDCWATGKPSQAILSSSHHQDDVTSKPLSTMYHRILQKEGVEFSHLPLYWEWAEDIIRHCKLTLSNVDLLDVVYTSLIFYECNPPMMQRFCESWCPLTNTLRKEADETSIRLWDIRTLSGLPITGMLYEEVVPVSDEMEDSKNSRHFLPFSCKYMFAALQRIRSKSGKSYATFEEWCRFWFRGLEQYSTTNTPKAVKNFFEFGDPTSWSDVHEAFVVLDIPEKHRKQTYLTTFLSCLNDLSNSSTPCQRREHFLAHYVYASVAQYFRSHCITIHNFAGATMIAIHGPNVVRTLTGADAKASNRSGKELNWVANSMNGTTDMKASSFFISFRGMNIHSRVTPAFASWWLGTGPSRKRKADNTTREAARKAPATSNDKVKNKAKPSRQSTSRSPRASSHGSSEDKSANFYFKTILVTLLANFDIAVELNACNNSFGAIASDFVALYAVFTIIARNSEAVHDASPIPTVAPSFKAQDMISEADRFAVGFLVKQMKTKLLHTPFSNTAALDPELKEIFGYITSKNIDVMSLREHAEAYVSHVRSFHALESSENVKPTLSSLEERLTDVELRLSDVVNLKRKEEEQIKLQQAEILKIEQRCDELQKELKLLEQKFELSSALATFEESLDKHDAVVTELTVSHSSIKKEIAATREATTKRKKAEENFQSIRIALESLHLEP
ncbi:Chorismate synthase [Bienertia sinuspersici]